MSRPIVIVGSGLAGYTLVRELRKVDKETPVLLITGDAGDFYSKPMLSTALAQNRTAPQLVTTPADAMATQLGVNLLKNVRVEAIDRQASEVVTSAGRFDYGRLVLALGADPIRIPLGGDAANEVLSVNDLDDYGHFRERLELADSVAILGAGLIGCEFANDLLAHGKKVMVLDPFERPLANLLPAAACADVRAGLSEAGVQWHLGRSARAVDRATDGSSGYRLTLDDGSTVNADLVLSAVGLRPRIALAEAAGLKVGRGIIVDEFLRTSDSAIYALGDCAQFGERILPYVLPIMHAARGIVLSLTGEPVAVRFPCMPVVVKTPACKVVTAPPAATAQGSWHSEGEPGNLKLSFQDAEGRLLGFALTGAATSQRMALSRLIDQAEA